MSMLNKLTEQDLNEILLITPEMHPIENLNGERFLCVSESVVINSHNALKEIVNSLKKYHLALDNREHGGIAQDHAVNEIESILGIYWKQGEELAKSRCKVDDNGILRNSNGSINTFDDGRH